MSNLSLVHAGALIGVRGNVIQPTGPGVPVTIYAPALGEPLPVKETAKSTGEAGAGVVTMSSWGKPVHVPAPRGAVPVKTVVGAK
jgi:hypothetical protein